MASGGRHVKQILPELSDADRPSKVVERYKDLFENEWTQAKEALTSTCGKDEITAVEILFFVLQECYRFCCNQVKEQADHLKAALLTPARFQRGEKIAEEFTDLLIDARKRIRSSGCSRQLEEFTIQLRTECPLPPNPLIDVYVKQAFELCWQMSLHEIPIVFGRRLFRGEELDAEFYESYESTGDVVDVVVFPCLLRGSDVLVKGKIQTFCHEEKVGSDFVSEDSINLHQEMRDVLKEETEQKKAIEKKCTSMKQERDESLLKLSEAEKALKQKDEEINKCRKEINHCSDLLKENESNRRMLEKNVKQQKQEVEKIGQELHQTKQSKKETIVMMEKKLVQNSDTLKMFQLRCEQLEKQLKEFEDDKNDVRSRNPNIADLSDADMPKKLGEKFTELYDNEWTNALETFTDTLHKDEKDAIEMLYSILTEGYSFCEKKLQEQFSLLERDLLHGGYTSVSMTDDKLSAGVRKILKDVRKMTSREAYANLLKAFRTTIDGTIIYAHNDVQNVEAYVEASFKLCYQMCLHDPPVALDSKPRHHDIIDENTYKEYTISGNKVDFAVWPALFLHKGGSLVCKGVVQPIRSEGINKKYTHSSGQDRQFQSRKTGKVDSASKDKIKFTVRKYGHDEIATEADGGYDDFNGSSVSYQVNEKACSHEKSYPSKTKDNVQTKTGEATKRIKSQPTFQISDKELDHFYDMYEVLGRRGCAQVYGYQYDLLVDAFNAREDERTTENIEIQMQKNALRAEEDARIQEETRRQKEIKRRAEEVQRRVKQLWEEPQPRVETQLREKAQPRVEAQQREGAQWRKEVARWEENVGREKELLRKIEEERQRAVPPNGQSRPKWR